MGKKRRAIHRSRKFTSKYYSWLDSVDRTGVVEANPAHRTDKILEGTKPYIRSLTVTDKGNQLIEVSAIHRGDCVTADDKVTFHLDGIEVFQTSTANGVTWAEQEQSSLTARGDAGVSADLVVADAGSGADRFTSVSAGTKLTDKSGVQFILKEGKHKLTAKYHDGGASGVGTMREKDSKTVSFTVKQHAITLSGSPFNDATDGQVNLNRSKFAAGQPAAISGYRNRGDLNNAKMDDTDATNGWTITVTRDVDGVATTVPVAAAASTDSNSNFNAIGATAINILAAAADNAWYDAADKLKLQVTLTPRDSGDRDAENDGKGRDLTKSAKTFEVEIGKP